MGRMQRKIFTLFIAVLALPSILIFLLLARLVGENLTETAVVSSAQLNAELIGNVDDRLQAVSQLTMQVYYNETLVEALERFVDAKGGGPDEAVIEKILHSFINSNRYLAAVYLRTGGKTYQDGMSFISVKALWDYAPAEATSVPGRIIWIPTMRIKSVFGDEYRCFAAKRSIRRSDRSIGELLLVFREQFFDRSYRSLRSEAGQHLTILSSEGIVVSSSVAEEVGRPSADPFILGLRAAERGSSFRASPSGERLAVYDSSDLTGWLFVNEMPSSVVLAGAIRLRRLLLVLVLPYAAFFLSMTYILSRSLTRPLRELAAAIDRIGEGKLDAEIPQFEDDEIGVLGRNIALMTGRISALLERVKEEEASKNKAELRFLRMQLSPHFVYNALNTIRWMAIMNGQDNIRDMLAALTKLMRNVSDPSEDCITLRRELELIQSYLVIQRMRYPDFDVELAVGEEVLDLELPKFVLQNLVENSIVHGMAGLERRGLVRISASRDGERLLLAVEDNGVGFEPEAMARRGAESRRGDEAEGEGGDSEHAHTGLESIRSRIRLTYGEAYGLSVRSEPGKGTAVELAIPARRREECRE
jgi:two-component system, sensor histidine kinase YesM